MMVPRSYMFQSGQRSTSPSPERKERVMGLATIRPRSTPPTVTATAISKPPTLPPRTASEPVSIPSAPMLIQPRSRSSARSQTQTLTSRGQHGGRKAQRHDPSHKPDALPPAVAALLAVTAIPPPRSLQRRRSSQSKRVSIDELVQEWRREGTESPAEKFKSPLSILLEPADEGEEDYVSLHETDDEKEPGFISSRSVSSDSIASTTPSLDAASSTMSTVHSPSPPSLASRRSTGETPRKEKLVCSPPTEECDDHPLRLSSPIEIVDDEYPVFTPRAERAPKPKSTFKSNLTASLNALKSAAKSFSNFTAPSIPSDDMLSRSLFAARFTSEMRPKGFHGVPDPALRRYLNPGVHQISLSSPDFPTQLQEALATSTWHDNHDEEQTPPMIQMQTYSRTRKRRSKSAGPLERGEGAVLGQSLPAIRQREPRENSDFLRVIVLEMSMRRVGKLDSKGPGRARVWLPPRKNVDSSEGIVRKDGIPSRWVGQSYTDEA
jgi:hypothetical protein